MKRSNKTVNIITMGCSKNLVDSERLMHMWQQAGYTVKHNPDSVKGGIVVVNTCGFIGDAQEESINMILECCQAKEQGLVSKVYVMGCLSQRFASELPAELPEVDGWYGKFDWAKMLADLGHDPAASKPWDRTLTTGPHHAYIKIAEGCNRHCAFCAIPIITGRYQSRPIEEIIEETKSLVAKGVKEFNVIAQDLSFYGKDLYSRHAIAELVDRMAQVPGVEWIRLHYAYPTDFPFDLLPVMAKHPNVCKYLDIALQHISDPVLDRMQRRITGKETRELLRRIRAEVPGISIRTTLMVGFPGETDADFEELMEFTREQRFERMGAFAYCEEEGTPAQRLYADDVAPEVKEDRLNRLMALQQEISAEHNDAMVGTRQRVIIDGYDADAEGYRGRTQYDSPEVDQEVLIPTASLNGATLAPGTFITVEITEALPFDLIGRPCAD